MEYILLSGGAGYIGSHTCVELQKRGYNVIIADDLSNSKFEAINRIKRIVADENKNASQPELLFFEQDVCDIVKLDKLFKTYKISAVIHFAGKKAVGESVEQPLEYYKNNLNATMALLECMKNNGCNRIIFSSSATVYGVPKQVPIKEGADTWCTNPYGWTKYMSEQIIRDCCVADSRISAILLRYFNPVGADKSGLIGEDPKDKPNNLMPYITKVAGGIYPHLNVFGNDYPTRDGTGVRDYIHVTDLALGHVAALDRTLNFNGCDEINLGTGTGYSVLEMVKAYETTNNVEIPYVIAPRRAGDVATCFADTEKAKKVLGWEAKLNLNDMCKSVHKWLLNNPNGYDE